MFRYTWIALMALAWNAGNASAGTSDSGHKAVAERFFRGVYGGVPEVVDELAADDIIIRYPIFQKLFGAPEVQGREAARRFAEGFGSRWVDPHITVDDVVAEGNLVVLLWTFRGKNVGSALKGVSADNQMYEWGGITLYRFDDAGKIVAEIGYEAEPAASAGGSNADAQKPR